MLIKGRGQLNTSDFFSIKESAGIISSKIDDVEIGAV